MRLVDRVRQRAATRAVPVPMTGLGGGMGGIEQQLFGSLTQRTDAGDYLASSNDFYSVAWLRAKMLAKLPVLATDGDKELSSPHPLVDLLNRPNEFWTKQRLFMLHGLSMATWGRSVFLIERGDNPGGKPRELWFVKPTQVRAVPHPTEYLTHFVYTTPDGTTEIPLRPDEVIEVLYPDPRDMYGALSPLDPARMAIEVATDSLKANRDLFRHGMMVGGFVTPEKDTSFSVPQAMELQQLVDQRFSGKGSAHRWQVLRYHLNLREMNVTPKDAQFVEGMNLTFRQVCRALGVPPPLVGDAEFATLANLRVYERQFWEQTGTTEADLLGAELTRQLGPAFGRNVHISLDLSQVVALQEDESERWSREREQIEMGALLINEWREEQGWETVEWGDVWWPAYAGGMPVGTDVQEGVAVEGEQPVADRSRVLQPPAEAALAAIALQFGDDYAAVVERLEDAILQRLRERSRDAASAARDPFDVARWTERTRAAVAARYEASVEATLISEARRVKLTAEQVASILERRSTRAAIEATTRRFSEQVTQTTWKRVQAELSTSLRKGETVKQMSSRVANVMQIRKEEARRIAQTEVTRARTLGQVAAYQEAGVPFKRWITQADGSVRETHSSLHGVTVELAETFTVGGYMALGPGQTGAPEEDINCRCYLQPVTQRTVGPDSDRGLVTALQTLSDTLAPKEQT